jgi:hypothetical protein
LLHHRADFELNLRLAIKRFFKAIEALREEKYDFGFLDRDLGFGEFGEDVARFMAENNFKGEVCVHSANPTGAEMIKKVLDDAKIKATIIPFTLLAVIRVPQSSWERS